MHSALKKIRENLTMTQADVSALIGVPLSTIRNWEQGKRNPPSWTLNLLIDRMMKERNEANETIDESSGVLSFMTIKKSIDKIAKQYDVKRMYLFGSYAKGEAKATSDVDLYMESELYGMDYFEFIEKLREQLHKKVEVLSQRTIEKDSTIDNEIRKTGVLIYER